MALPIYKNQEDVRYGIKQIAHLAQPVIFKDDEFLMTIQIEAKLNRKTMKTFGFNPSDDQIVKIVGQYLAMQVEKTFVKKQLNNKEQAIISTLQLTSEICTQRHFSGLFKKMREFMPKFFGFQGTGVLLYDRETNWFFTD